MGKCPQPEKIAHATRDHALMHMRALLKRGGSPDLNVYRCTAGHWHVGHSVISLSRRIRSALRARYQ